MFSPAGVDVGFVSPEHYDELLEEVEITYLPKEVTKCSFMNARGGPRSRTGHDHVTITTAEYVYCQAGIPIYKQGLSHGVKGTVPALGYALQDTKEWKPLVESF